MEDRLFIYKPLKDDPIDQNLANYINRAPLRLRSKMQFEREAPGIYRFARKKVFMKIEGETIVIRVGGGYLTIQEFVAMNCGYNDDEQKKRITNLVYAGKCAGNKDFKTFYFSQHTMDDKECLQAADEGDEDAVTIQKARANGKATPTRRSGDPASMAHSPVRRATASKSQGR